VRPVTFLSGIFGDLQRVIARRGSCIIFVTGQPTEGDARLQAPPPAPSQRATQGFVTQIFEAVRPDKGGDLPVSRRARNPPQGRGLPTDLV
jgi:hypothetical protein